MNLKIIPRPYLISGAFFVVVIAAWFFLRKPAVPQNPPPTWRPPRPRIERLSITDLTLGQGSPVRMHQNVQVEYTAWLFNAAAPDFHGAMFDRTSDRKKLFKFRLGEGQAIKGLDFGVQGMKINGRRLLVVPAYLGYGDKGAGDRLVPPDSDLVYDVRLVKVDHTKN